MALQEQGKPYPREFQRSDYPWVNLDLALRAHGVPSVYLDGKEGPEFHTPDGKVTDRDVILYVGRNWEKDKDVREALAQSGIPEEKFWKIYSETLRTEFSKEITTFQDLVKTDPAKAQEKLPVLEAYAFEIQWQADGAPREEQIEILKLQRRYDAAGIALFTPLARPPQETPTDAQVQINVKLAEFKERLSSEEDAWSRLVAGKYPGAEDLDEKGFLKGE